MVKSIPVTTKTHEEKSSEILVQKKLRGVKIKEETCRLCGLILRNKLLLCMHLRFEHEDDNVEE